MLGKAWREEEEFPQQRRDSRSAPKDDCLQSRRPPKPPEGGGPGLDTLPGALEAVVGDWAPEGPEAQP